MMFFRRLQLPQNDGLSARPGARVDRALLPWSHGANPIAAAQVRNLGSQGTPANRGVFRPASWISGVLLWQLPARNTLEIARVAARNIRKLPSLYCALLRRPAAVRAAVATNCSARQQLRCNMQQSQKVAEWFAAVSLLAQRRDACRASQRVLHYRRCLARGDYSP